MAYYRVYRHPNNSVPFITKVGIYWLALIMPQIWFPLNRMWFETLISIAVILGMAGVFAKEHNYELFIFIFFGYYYCLYLCGKFAHVLLESNLESRGFVYEATVVASTPSKAREVYAIKKWDEKDEVLARTTERKSFLIQTVVIGIVMIAVLMSFRVVVTNNLRDLVKATNASAPAMVDEYTRLDRAELTDDRSARVFFTLTSVSGSTEKSKRFESVVSDRLLKQGCVHPDYEWSIASGVTVENVYFTNDGVRLGTVEISRKTCRRG